jgi:hypothetical protein
MALSCSPLSCLPACTDGGEGNKKKKFNALSVDGRVLCYAL